MQVKRRGTSTPNQERRLASRVMTSAPLMVLSNHTYLANVTLDGKTAQLLVDTTTRGVWVDCTIFNASCRAAKHGVGDETERIPRLDTSAYIETQRFKTAKVAGRSYSGFDVYLVGRPLISFSTDEDANTIPFAELGAQVQGILGLSDSYTSPLFVDDQVESIMFRLGASAADSSLLFDGVDQAWIKKKNLIATLQSTATGTTAGWTLTVKCFKLPLADGSIPSICDYSSDVALDSAYPYIKMDTSILDDFDRRFAIASCTLTDSTYYICDKQVELPQLNFTIGSWTYILDKADYTEPLDDDKTKVKVLLTSRSNGYYSFSSSWALGTPFLRKFPTVYNKTTDNMTVYCQLNKTCVETPSPGPSYGGYTYYTPSPTYDTTYGGYGGGGVYSGDDVSSPYVDIEVTNRSRRGRNIALGIGIPLGVALLVAFITWLRKSGNDEVKTVDAAAANIPAAIEVDDDDDSSDSDDVANAKIPVAIEVDDDDSSDSDDELKTKKKHAGGHYVAVKSPRQPSQRE
ncbi:hypothetical protein Poli38472_012314 [Pythium oligandrum]|uniref:Peptidase A1 domain-containing protein n=1 Tax=Pythium oligandrum TaxID=41045 RepID=A0A8K1FR34_PYTOL|nr:hypothetical protein Poli38472_012314 [Pythium oligandrum]|eukprot:TMW67198.1 hypothetical protein Poli38472_012314 [Pythium oligandrum]